MTSEDPALVENEWSRVITVTSNLLRSEWCGETGSLQGITELDD